MKDSCTRDAQNLFSAITVKKVGWVALNITCARQITLKNVLYLFVAFIQRAHIACCLLTRCGPGAEFLLLLLKTWNDFLPV